jgi:hypothetical protein
MYCEYCGYKLEKDQRFCPNCGRVILVTQPDATPPIKESLSEAPQIFLYSKKWQYKKRGLTLSNPPEFDLMIDDKYLYLIELPKTSKSVAGFFIGLVILNIIGALIGHYIGESMDEKKRSRHRSPWISQEGTITSKDYEKYTYLKLPLLGIRHIISFEKKYFVLNFSGNQIRLKNNVKEYGTLRTQLERNVL